MRWFIGFVLAAGLSVTAAAAVLEMPVTVSGPGQIFGTPELIPGPPDPVAAVFVDIFDAGQPVEVLWPIASGSLFQPMPVITNFRNSTPDPIDEMIWEVFVRTGTSGAELPVVVIGDPFIFFAGDATLIEPGKWLFSGLNAPVTGLISNSTLIFVPEAAGGSLVLRATIVPEPVALGALLLTPLAFRRLRVRS